LAIKLFSSRRGAAGVAGGGGDTWSKPALIGDLGKSLNDKAASHLRVRSTVLNGQPLKKEIHRGFKTNADFLVPAHAHR
jgi:hypothetical protein